MDARTPGPASFSKCVINLFSECSIGEKKEESQRKVWGFDRLSEETSWMQLDDLSLCQSALPRSLGKFFEVGRSHGKMKIEKSGHLMKETLL